MGIISRMGNTHQQFFAHRGAKKNAFTENKDGAGAYANKSFEVTGSFMSKKLGSTFRGRFLDEDGRPRKTIFGEDGYRQGSKGRAQSPEESKDRPHSRETANSKRSTNSKRSANSKHST